MLLKSVNGMGEKFWFTFKKSLWLQQCSRSQQRMEFAHAEYQASLHHPAVCCPEKLVPTPRSVKASL